MKEKKSSLLALKFTCRAQGLQDPATVLVNLSLPHGGTEVVTATDVLGRFGVEPRFLPDVLAVIGDPKENLPSVPQVGIKTAAKIVTEFGGIEKVLERLAEVKPVTRRDSLAACQGQIMDSLSLIK